MRRPPDPPDALVSLIEGVCDARSCGDPVGPAAQAHQRCGSAIIGAVWLALAPPRCWVRRWACGAGHPWPMWPAHPSAEAQVARLEELRLAAAEDRAEAELAVGGQGGIVAELQALLGPPDRLARPRTCTHDTSQTRPRRYGSNTANLVSPTPS
jgi:hypothetical protein